MKKLFWDGGIWLVLMLIVILLILTACGDVARPACAAGQHWETRQEWAYTIEPGFNISTGKYDIGTPGYKLVTRSYCVPD